MSSANQPYGAIRDGALAIQGGRIAWLGPMTALPHHNAREIIELHGSWVTPGLIDCHTHLVFGGNRAAEFELRLEGVEYEEIARRGGGIPATGAATPAGRGGETPAPARRGAR